LQVDEGLAVITKRKCQQRKQEWCSDHFPQFLILRDRCGKRWLIGEVSP